MKPFYERGGITLYHADCREVLPTLGAVDLVLTDPPYGIGVCNRSDGGGVCSAKSGNRVYERESWDAAAPSQAIFDTILSLNTACIIWGGNYFDLPPTKCLLVWDKKQRDFSLADAEIAWTNFDKSVRIFDYARGQLSQEGKVHPTQKPVPLMRWCLGFAPKAQSVLDPFTGSGTTGVACVQLGRKFTGIEISEKYCQIAAKRIDQELDKGRLFEPQDLEQPRQETLSL